MLFSYYFDAEKTHLLNCRFQVLTFTEKAAGVIEILFSAEMAEIKNGIQSKREAQIATFSFPPNPLGTVKHDIDFTRVRYGDQKKWIFTVINNKDTAQNIAVGLISETANKNPLGLDVYHDDEAFNVELKANTLSILEQNYVPPVLTQTMVNTGFTLAGYPERFSSLTGFYDGTYQNFKASDFVQDFLEAIPTNAYFKAQMDLAPTEIVTLPNVNELFTVTIPNLGRITLLKNGLEYMIEGGLPNDIKRITFPAVTISDFWNGGMTSKARLIIEGDGAGHLSVKYNGAELTGAYDVTKTFSSVNYKGAMARNVIMTGDPTNDPTINPNNWIQSRVDNITVIYRK